ncbi:MAG: YaaL family protein [Clostridia bacterium]
MLWGKKQVDQEERQVLSSVEPDDQAYLEEVRKAWQEWNAAQNYFENVSDPDLIDYAIYDLEAARRKYMYMLKQARSRGLRESKYLT